MLSLKNLAIGFLLGTMMILSGCSSPKDGRLEGNVTIGPLTPVEQVGAPTSTPPPEVFTSRGIRIYNSLGILMDEVHFNADGTYSVGLPPGKYRVELLSTGIEHSAQLPAVVQIYSNQTTILNISIDTGVR